MRKKYLVLLLIPLLIAFAGCGKKKYVAPPPPPPELEAPSNLTVTVVSYKQIDLFWQDNSTIEDGFRVWCDMGGNQYQTVDTLPPNTISFEHYNLQPITKYTYYIQAYKGNEYANSREVSATTSCPIQIVSPTIIGYGEDGVRVYGSIKNNASENCQVQLTATFYDMDGYKIGSKTTSVFTLSEGEYCVYDIIYTSDRQISFNYDLEVTTAKILY